MYLGDNILKSGIKEFVDGFEKSDYQARILLQYVENPRQFGVAELDSEGHVMNLVEKPEHPKATWPWLVYTSSNHQFLMQFPRSNHLGGMNSEITDAIQEL